MNAPLPDIAIIGLAQAGKDTAATLIMEEDPRFHRVAFADPVREMALRLDPFVEVGDRRRRDYWRLSQIVGDVGDWEEAKKLPDVRRLLQRMGTEAVRTVAPNFWVDLAMQTADAWAAEGGRTVFTDARFPNEVHAILRRPGVVVRVVRPGAETAIGKASEHASEQLATSFVADYTLVNDGTLDDLRREVRHMLAQVDLFHHPRPF